MWKLLLVHAFNPILIGIVLLSFAKENEERSAANDSTSQKPMHEMTLKDVPHVYLTGLIFYSLFWFLPHYFFVGSEFESETFFGVGEPTVYYLPYAFGLLFLLYRTALRPRLVRHASPLLGVVTALIAVLFSASAYCLLVFYLKWL